MEKFAYLKCAQNNRDIHIKSRFIRFMPKYFRDKYIVKNNPIFVEDIEILNVLGYNITVPIFETEIESLKANTVLDNTLKNLEFMDVISISSDIPIDCSKSKIVYMDGKNILQFFLLYSLQKAIKFTDKNIKYAEILIIDGDDEYKTYNTIKSIYDSINYLTLFTYRPEFFKSFAEKIYSDTGLNLQIVEQNKSAIKDADIIINLSADIKVNFDYFYKKGAIYFELSDNIQKELELLRKREDINVIDNISFSCNGKYVENSILESILYVSTICFKDFIDKNLYPENKIEISKFIKSVNLNITGFYQYGNIIRQYKS